MTNNIELREALILKLVSNKYSEKEEIFKILTKIQRKSPVSRLTALKQLFAAATFRPDLTKIESQGLVLCSKKDRLVNPEASRKIAKELDIPCFEHPTAGHDLPLDDSSWIVQQIDRFLL